ncbi:extracellular matrix protein A [Biomphalaria pfeifferi]|uniref:Extracellular matrix protein A n=1 Tax=Biomphalaria pfeifferi TaxID=112525 RepID=A0AAD8FIP5_BIOPF|nr:extracellular matrix protein A [Biomphalaria pfeifferi]
MYLLLLLTLTLFSLVTWCQRTDGSCLISNTKVFKNNVVFTLPGLSRCTKHICRNGKIEVYEHACDFEGHCYLANSTFQLRCIVYKCMVQMMPLARRTQVALLENNCLDMFGQCHKPGARFPVHKDGITYGSCTCKTDLTGNRINVCKTICEIDGKVYAENQTFERDGKPCMKYVCYHGAARIIEAGCLFKNKCHPPGEVINNQCKQFKCVQKDNSGYLTFEIEYFQASCMDDKGVCRSPGEIFPYKQYKRCECGVKGIVISLSCLS